MDPIDAEMNAMCNEIKTRDVQAAYQRICARKAMGLYEHVPRYGERYQPLSEWLPIIYALKNGSAKA